MAARPLTQEGDDTGINGSTKKYRTQMELVNAVFRQYYAHKYYEADTHSCSDFVMRAFHNALTNRSVFLRVQSRRWTRQKDKLKVFMLKATK